MRAHSQDISVSNLLREWRPKRLTFRGSENIFARVEKPPDDRERRRLRPELFEEKPRIILTDEDAIQSSVVPSVSGDDLATKERQEHEQEPKQEGIFGKEFESGKRSYARILKHSSVLILVLALGYSFHRLLLWTNDPKIFDYVPWRYVLDGADLIIVTRLVMVIWRELGKDD